VTKETVRLLVPFEALLDCIAESSFQDKVLLRESLDERIESAGEETPETEAGIQGSRDAYERGDYVTIDEYVYQQRKGA